jgi:hypothetical protein
MKFDKNLWHLLIIFLCHPRPWFRFIDCLILKIKIKNHENIYELFHTWVWGLHSQRYFKILLWPRFNSTKLNTFKFLGSSNIDESCHCKALKALKLLGMVLIKFPSKDNDFKFVRSPTFEGNPIPSPNEHPPRFKWLSALTHPKLLRSISRLGFLDRSRCSRHPKLLGRVFKCLHVANFNTLRLSSCLISSRSFFHFSFSHIQFLQLHKSRNRWWQVMQIHAII